METGWRNATRLLTLVNSLLTFSSLEAGAPVAMPGGRPGRAHGRTRRRVPGRRRAGRTGSRGGLPAAARPVAVDPVNWERIVTNLLSNALKYTFIGRIRVTLDADDEEVRLTVADTGIGISERDLPKLFERFHRCAAPAPAVTRARASAWPWCTSWPGWRAVTCG
ncbi:HAMP domain-containing sensor histidine kinase [Micromonospora sp. M12]